MISFTERAWYLNEGPRSALDEASQVPQELPGQGLVEVVLGPEVLLDLGRKAPLGVERPPGRRAHEEEAHEEDDEQQGNGGQEPADQEPEHAVLSGPRRAAGLVPASDRGGPDGRGAASPAGGPRG